jgi:hypothetical protein
MNDGVILTAMERHGSSFARALAHACRLGTADDVAAIRGAFPILWAYYAQLAAQFALQGA